MSKSYKDGVVDLMAGWPAQVMAHYSPENPACPVDVVDGYGSWTAAGVRVNHNNATSLASVWQAVLQISSDISKLPLELHRKTTSGDVEIASNHPAYYPVKHQPNGELQSVKFWRRAMVHLLLWGNAYIWVEWTRRGGQLVPSLYNLLPDRTHPERVDGNLQYVTEVQGSLRTLSIFEVIHLENFVDRECMQGMDPTKEARDSWGLALARQQFASRFFRMGGRVGGILEMSAATPKPRRDAAEKAFRQVYENSDQAFRTVVLRENAKFHAAQHTFEDTQMVESSKDGVRDVARWFNMKPSRLGEEGGQYYGSKSEDNRDYLDTTLSPHMAMIRAECERVLLSPRERRSERYWWKWNTDALLQPTRLERYQAHEIGIRSEFLSPNEAREFEGMNQRAGGDRYGNPNINPSAHVAAIEDIARTVVFAIVSKRWRRKTDVGSDWWNDRILQLASAIMPTVKAYTSVFGGNPESLARKISTDLCAAVRSTNRLMDPPAQMETIPVSDLINGALRDD